MPSKPPKASKNQQKFPVKKTARSGVKSGAKSAPLLSEQAQKRLRLSVGVVFFLAALALAAGLTGLTWRAPVTVYQAGEVAGRDVAAHQDLLLEDEASTRAKRQALARSQPPVYDLSPGVGRRIEERVAAIFARIDGMRAATHHISETADGPQDRQAAAEFLERLRWQVSERLNAEIAPDTFKTLQSEEVQRLVTDVIMPWLKANLGRGVVAEAGGLARAAGGIMLRDTGTQTEVLHTDTGAFKDMAGLRQGLSDLLRDDLKIPLRTRKAVENLLTPMLRPSLTLNEGRTKDRRAELMNAVEPVYYSIKKGEVIVRKGERVTAAQQQKLQALVAKRPEGYDMWRPAGVFVLALLFAAGTVVSPRGRFVIRPGGRDLILLGLVVLGLAGGAKLIGLAEASLGLALPSGAAGFGAASAPYAYPVAGAAGLLALYLPRRMFFFVCLLLSFLTAQMFHGAGSGGPGGLGAPGNLGADLSGGLALFPYYFVGAVFYGVLVKRTEDRSGVLRTVLPLTAMLLAAWLGTELASGAAWEVLAPGAPYVVAGALLSLLSLLALSPVIELTMGFTSRFRLMELMNLERPLLRELMVNVPGTYHHSLIVANMVEAGARAIGANALQCKVAALYHDIGKMENPQYFIENQFTDKNKHDKLAPALSAKIITAHVDNGVELAKRHKLGADIAAIIQQHHGDSTVGYFYHKALNLSQAKGAADVDKKDFQYAGPKPQTKEAGIVLLADAIEASSRSLAEPTPGKLKEHVEAISRKIFSEGQLDDSDLTFKDLKVLGDTFQRILTGIFHTRIEYPRAASAKPEEPAEREAEGQERRRAARKKAAILEFESASALHEAVANKGKGG